MDRIDHTPDCRINDRARFFRVDVFDQVHRALDVREQRGDGLALALCRERSVCLLRYNANTRC
jgi:hypothetical protein